MWKQQHGLATACKYHMQLSHKTLFVSASSTTAETLSALRKTFEKLLIIWLLINSNSVPVMSSQPVEGLLVLVGWSVGSVGGSVTGVHLHSKNALSLQDI